MKILGTILSALTALLLAGVPANARTVFSDKKAKATESEGVRARVWLNKGETRALDGYLRSALVNRPDHIEFSLTPDGERARYVNEDVDSLLLEGTDK